MIDLDTVKSHLRVDGDEEDSLIQGYTDAAFSTFELWTNRKLIAEGGPLPEPVGNALNVTKAINQGALMLIGYWYANRETVILTGSSSFTDMPLATRALWSPHRWTNF
jgi:hypothetical protein